MQWTEGALIRNNSLEFVAAPALEPAQVVIDQELMKKYEQELAAVSSSRNMSFSYS